MTRKLGAILFACILSCATTFAQTLEVNFAVPDPTNPAWFGHDMNLPGGSEPFTPADLKFYKEQFGRMNLVRIWGTTYIDYASQISDEAMIILGKDIDLDQLLNGTLTEDQELASLEKSLGAIKAKYPFVTYVDPFNELNAEKVKLPKGMTIEEAYYKGFRVAMRAVTELNRKNHYAKPMLVGAPGCTWPAFRKGYVDRVLAAYAKDPDPAKHIDFITVHYYPDDYAAATTFRKDVEASFAQHHVPLVPLIMGEIGWKEKNADKYNTDKMAALRWATGAMSHTYEIVEQNMMPMHWVYPRKEDRMSMVGPANEPPALTPKGNIIRMAQMLKQTHVKSSIDIDKDGNGVYSVATYDDSGVAILLFNYDGKGEPVKKVTLKLLNSDRLGSKSGVVTEYQLDHNHADYFTDKKAWQLVPVSDGTKALSALSGKSVELNGNSALLIVISYAK